MILVPLLAIWPVNCTLICEGMFVCFLIYELRLFAPALKDEYSLFKGRILPTTAVSSPGQVRGKSGIYWTYPSLASCQSPILTVEDTYLV